MYLVNVKSTVKILSIFVAFLENMNFKKLGIGAAFDDKSVQYLLAFVVDQKVMQTRAALNLLIS